MKRIDWIDNAKALAIILVVIGHAGIPVLINSYILSFHMPLFFVVSGFLYNEDKYSSVPLIEYAKKRFKRLIVPYLWFSVATVMLSTVIQYIVKGKLISLVYPILSILLCTNIKNSDMIESVLWFLPCIFVVELLFVSFRKFTKSNAITIVFVIMLSIISYILSITIGHKIPFTIDIAFFALLFYGIGFVLKKEALLFMSNISDSKRKAIMVALIGFSISLLSVYMNSSNLLMYINQYGNYFWTIIGAFGGVITWLSISTMFTVNAVTLFFSKNSLLVFVIHLKILFISNRVIANFNNIIHANGWVILVNSLLNALIVLLILIPIIKIVDRYLPFLMGQKSNKIWLSKVN